MLSKLIVKHHLARSFKIVKPFKMVKPSLYYLRFAQFGLLEDKLKEIRKQAFDRVGIAKGEDEAAKKKRADEFARHANLKLFDKREETQQGYLISGMTLEELIDRLKRAIEQQESSTELYLKIIERFQEIIIDEPDTTGKPEILRILRALCHYRPKDEELLIRQAKNKGYVMGNKDYISKRHREIIKKKAYKSAMPISIVADHFKEGLKLNYLKGMFTDYSPGTEETMAPDIYDVLEKYKNLFQNIELVVQEDLNRANFDHREILDVMVAFSIAGEGTNVMFERIYELIIPALKENKYTKHDVELIVNYFPNEFFMHSQYYENKEVEFYEIIGEAIEDEVKDMDKRELISFFQAFSSVLSLSKSKILRGVLNTMLNKFAKEIESNNLEKDEFLNFLEIYTIMIDENPILGSHFDSKLLWKIASNYLEKNYNKTGFELSLNDVAGLYWVYAKLGIFTERKQQETIKPLEKYFKDLLVEYIRKHKPLSAAEIEDGIKQNMEFDDKDMDTIQQIYQTKMEYEKAEGSPNLVSSKEILKAIKEIRKKYDDRPENERKWFVW